MKKLPLKEYKKRCAELWDWLADNPGEWKVNWSQWESNGGKYESVINGCFACEYTLNEHFIDCNKCFLLDLWFRGKIPKNIKILIDTDNEHVPCEKVRYSPFRLWCKHKKAPKFNNAKISLYARMIADYCRNH